MAAFIAKLGVNPYWIAANAHFWFTCSIMMLVHGNLWVLGALVVAAACKEFVFDAKYEVPAQSAFDNWTDFAGYVAGAIVGALI